MIVLDMALSINLSLKRSVFCTFFNCFLLVGLCRMNTRIDQCLCLFVCVLLLLKTEGSYVNITYVQSAVSKGAGEKILLRSSTPLLSLLSVTFCGIREIEI